MATTVTHLRDVVFDAPRRIPKRILLACGIAAPIWWVVVDVIGSLRYSGYSYIDQTISELSAEAAPTRLFMLTVSGVPYFLMMLAFGIGVWQTADGRRAQRATGALLIAEAAWGFTGGILFPMAIRGNEASLRNEMHVIYGIGMPVLFILALVFGSRLLGTRFRYFSYATVIVLLAAGMLTGMQSPRVETNEPTPWIGVEERTNAYAAMLWVAALAGGLLRQQHELSRQS